MKGKLLLIQSSDLVQLLVRVSDNPKKPDVIVREFYRVYPYTDELRRQAYRQRGRSWLNFDTPNTPTRHSMDSETDEQWDEESQP